MCVCVRTIGVRFALVALVESSSGCHTMMIGRPAVSRCSSLSMFAEKVTTGLGLGLSRVRVRVCMATRSTHTTTITFSL